MTRWQFVLELFEQTVKLSAADRGSILRARTNGDPELAGYIESLVAADASPLKNFDRPATELLEGLTPEPPAMEFCGDCFGPYRIDEHVASGGMAHVYRATRTSAGTERRVALKVLRPGLDTDAFLRRFQRERETLAGLEHEHIVAFLDAGALPDGRPYLVMEYVDGEPLTRWGQGVTLRRRIELFLKVLATVQYAHQQLIVHRDLKPSNVLVTPGGSPKLLDFGVATALAPDGDGESGRGPLTLSYASPEQLRGAPITTVSDIYSLGVLLHELVAGDLPATGGLATGQLAGDLGLIVRKALAPDPAHRYRSADHLASDLRRHLDHEPISARSGGWAYRSSLFARRNLWPLVLAASVFVALIVGWVGSDLDRRLAEEDANTGWGAHYQARFAVRVLESWLATTAAADIGLGREASAHLERALEEDLAELPEAEALIRLTLAEVYLGRGDRERAAGHAESAWELVQSTRGMGRRDRERAAELRERVREPR